MSDAEDFDDVIEMLGGFGKYQKRLLYLLLGPLFFIMPFPLMHQVLVLSSPPHECIPPAHLNASTLGISKGAWQEIMLPKDHMAAPSSCNYFDLPQSKLDYITENADRLVNMSLPDLTSIAKDIQNGSTTAACTAWEYDQTEFYDTAVTENNWVCDKAMWIADLYTLATVGLILGTFIFSAIADFFGRKTSFYIGAAAVIVFTLSMIPTSFNFSLFAFFKVAAAFGMLPLFQSPLSILCEISNVSKRGFVLCYGCLTWSLGQMAFPLVGYLIGSWKLIKAVSVLPLALFFLTWKMLPESPRWLVTKGKSSAAVKILRNIAETNSVQPPADLEQRIDKMAKAQKGEAKGYLSLFSSRTLGIRTVLCTITFTASAFVYYQMVINVSYMMGNTFINLFLLGLVEGPGNMIGVVLANKIGRRWTHCSLLLLNAILFAAIMPVVSYPQASWASPMLSFLCMWIKMNIAATFIVAYIQAMEIFPTCVRQSGVGFCSFISQIISIGGPYVLTLGMTDPKLPYMVMFLICLVGSVAASFLPETVGAKLPETLEDAEGFARTDKYFSYKPERYEAPVAQKNIVKNSAA